MSADDNEREISEMFEKYHSKKIPAKITRGFEEDVMKKVSGNRSLPMAGMIPALGLGVAAAVLMYFVLMHFTQPSQVPAADVPAKAVEASVAEEQNQGSVAKEEGMMQAENKDASESESLSEDILILELLGEDEGLMDDLELFEADVEILTQWIPVATTA